MIIVSGETIKKKTLTSALTSATINMTPKKRKAGIFKLAYCGYCNFYYKG